VASQRRAWGSSRKAPAYWVGAQRHCGGGSGTGRPGTGGSGAAAWRLGGGSGPSGAGVGRAALDALCRTYAERGFWKLVSRIFSENIASLVLHERCGFRVVGVYRRHAKLHGKWRDCVIVEKLIDGREPGL